MFAVSCVSMGALELGLSFGKGWFWGREMLSTSRNRIFCVFQAGSLLGNVAPWFLCPGVLAILANLNLK